MANVDMSYDDAVYRARLAVCQGEHGGAATTQYGKFAAFTASRIRAFTMTVTTAGTITSHAFAIVKISHVTTSTMALTTLGLATAGVTTTVDLSANANATTIAGDVIAFLSSVDATGKIAGSVELQLQAGATVRA